ncbi:MAG: TatD family hydrolase [Pseudomonadota bacterium]
MRTGKPILIDSHCHLDYLQERGGDLEQLLQRMRKAGVAGCVTISTSLDDFNQVLDIAHTHSCVVCSAGLHPHNADKEKVSTKKLVELANDPDLVAIGETGLDYYYNNAPVEAQKRAFACHLEAASETNLPVIIHTRQADRDTVELLQAHYAKKPFSGIIHCFTASRWLGDAAIELGMGISISGIITFKKANRLRDDVAHFGIEHLLVETDAPYLAPIPKRGQDNEPAFTRFTAAALAELLGLEFDLVAKHTTENFARFFTKAQKRLIAKGLEWPEYSKNLG